MCELPERTGKAELCGILAPAGVKKKHTTNDGTVNATGGDALKFPLQHCFLTPGAE